MTITPQFLYEISSQLLSFNQICDLFGLSEEERKNPSAGRWIIDRIKQYQTAAIIAVEVKKRKEGLTIENYEQKLPDPLKSQPLETPLSE